MVRGCVEGEGGGPFEEVQARTRDLQEALQQQTATANVPKVISRSALDLQTVLTTWAESARELCAASFVALSLREGDAMRLRAESGCTPEIIQFMGAHPIRAGRETFTGRVMLSGEAGSLVDSQATRSSERVFCALVDTLPKRRAPMARS